MSVLLPATGVFDCVKQWERDKPDEVALRYLDRAWTWREWAERIRRAANALLGEGLSGGARVAFLDKNSAACLDVSLAGVLAGTASVVVNQRLAAPEIAWVINDARARLLFVGEELLPVIEQIRADLATVEKVLVVGGSADEYEDWLASASGGDTAAAVSMDDCFLQLYTSGTTGFPKGAMLTQRSLMAHTRAGVPTFGFDAQSVAMVAMPLFHVSGFSWALQSIAAGGVTIVVRDVVPEAVLEQLTRDRVTHAFFVPAVYQLLLGVPGVEKRDYSSLRCLGYGGAPMPLPLLERCLEVFGTNFFQVYGMTELSGAFCVLGPEEHRDASHPERLQSAGKPMPGSELRIVDPATEEPRAPGEVGEIQARSEAVMAGYWQLPDASRAVLAGGWLHTGDAGRLDEDGYVYIEDRVKDMFISGGENVYPAEVERALVEHPAVAEVAVVGVPDEKWGEVGKAFVVPRNGDPIDAEELLKTCRARLAAYKCPRSVEIIAELPRNATGKVLKHKLRAPYWEGRSRAI